MKISNSSRYGLMAVGYVATHSKDGNIMSDTIAKEYNIPLEYLLKILQQLVRMGILNSKRGPHGGFTLGRELNKITLLDIFEAIDGPTASEYYIAKQTKNEHFAVKMEKVCEKATAEQNRSLQATTFAELVESSIK